MLNILPYIYTVIDLRVSDNKSISARGKAMTDKTQTDRTQLVIWLSWILIVIMNAVTIWGYFRGR